MAGPHPEIIRTRKQPPEAPAGGMTETMERQRAGVAGRIGPGWEVWYIHTPFDPGGSCWWSARPAGALCATCMARTTDGLAKAVLDYQALLPRHLAEAREALARTPERDASRREMLAALVSALDSLGQPRPAG